MKKIIIFLYFSIFFSCSSNKNIKYNNYDNIQAETKSEYLLSAQIDIVNDFLEVELNSPSYKSKLENSIYVVDDAGNGTKNILTYEYAYNDFYNNNDEVTIDDIDRLGLILNSQQTFELKNQFLSEKKYLWKNSDFKNLKITIIKMDTLSNYLKGSEYLNLSNNIILFIQKPVMINKNDALISIYSRIGFVGHNISNYTALMTNIEGKWYIKNKYWDGSME
jgi:hypothetical protein